MKYKAKKGLSAKKAKTMLKDNQAQGHALTKKQKSYFGFVAGGGKPKAAQGMMNADASQNPGQPQGQPQQAQPQGQQAPPFGGISVTVQMVAEIAGQQSNLGTMKIQRPEDLKKVIQVIMQVFQQGQQQQAPPEGGQPQGQPAEQQPAQPQQ